MPSTTGTDLSKYATWPVYAGYGPWTLTKVETDIPGAGTNDLLIDKELLPSVQYAIRYNPYSNEIPIDAWAAPPIVSIANFAYTAMGTLDASYTRWVDSGYKACAMFDVTGGVNSESNTTFGIIPPTFEYSILDQFKETVHYGMHGTFFLAILLSGVNVIISMDSFYGYLQYICRARMKSFRLFDGEISSVSYDSGKGSATWTYKISTTLRNDITDTLDISSDGVELTIYKANADGTYSGTTQTGVVVKSITGTSMMVEAPAATGDIPDGWKSAYFTMSKTILVRDPQTLYYDRPLSSGANIPDNNYVKETSLGYETREQQIEDSGEGNGIYASKAEILSLLDKKILDTTTYTTVEIDAFKTQVEFINGKEDSNYGGKVIILQPEEMIYGEFNTAWGTRLTNYVNELKPQFVTLYISIGGGATLRHNMHAGCLAGEYFKSDLDVYKVSGHIRKNIYQLNVISKTSVINLIEKLVSLTDPTTYKFSVRASRMWFINDITYNNGQDPSCDEALFWGNVTTAPLYSSLDKSTTFTFKVTSFFKTFNSSLVLSQRFLQTLIPTNSVKKWNDSIKEWYFNTSSNSGSFKIKNITYNSSSDDFTIFLDGNQSTSISVSDSDYWWISFDEKFETSGGYGYITTPYLAMDGTVAAEDGGRYNSVVLNGLYVGLPLREPLTSSSLVSLVLESGGIYPNTNLPPFVYISTARKGSTLYFCRNLFNDKKMLLYMKKDDAAMTFFVRAASMNFIYDIDEYIVYYGDEKIDSSGITVSGAYGTDQTIDFGNLVTGNYILGVSIKRTAAPTLINGTFPYSIWEVYHGNYLIGYPSTSGLVSTLYSRRSDGKYLTEQKDYVANYKPATITSSNEIRFYIAANIENENIANNNLITFSPVYNALTSSQISSAKLHSIPNSNVVKNVTSPYLFTMDDKMNSILYCKKQTWLREGESSSNIIFSPIPLLAKVGRITSSTIFDPSKEIDPKQDGVFSMITTDQFKSYSAGLFGRPVSSGIYPDQGQDITQIPDSTLGESVLYKIPFLLVSNITRCSYAQTGGVVDIIGFSGLKSTETDTMFGILSLVHHRVNLLDLASYSTYIVKDTGGKYVFSYCDLIKNYKRLIAESQPYAQNASENPVFVDSSLSEGPITIAAWNSIMMVVVQQASGIVYLISSNSGYDWTYFDDIPLVSSISGSVSSPSVKIYDGTIWLFYIVGSQQLYLKKIPLSIFLGLTGACRGVKTSTQKDSSIINEKNNLAQQLNTRYLPVLVGPVNDQQVSFELDGGGFLHVIYQGTDGGIKGIGSSDKGNTWDFTPVNF